MKIGIHEAKTKLSKLIPAALSGEEVIITKAGKPLVKLVPIRRQGTDRPLGIYADKIKLPEDLLAPLPEDITEAFWTVGDDNALSS